MLRNTMLTAAVLASLSLAAGCKKAGKGAMGGAAGAMSDVLPKETGFMVGISLNKLRTTKLWETVSKKATEDPEAKKTIDELKADCGMDLMTGIVESVVIAGPEDYNNEQKMLIHVAGKFSENKVNDCIVKMVQKKDQKKVAIAKEGPVSVYSVEGETKKLYAAWLGEGSVLISSDETGAYLKEVLAKKSSYKQNAMLAGLLAQVDTGALVYGAGIVPKSGDAAGALGAMGAKPEGAYGTVNYQKDLDATIGLRFASDAEAKTTADQINKELEGQKGSNPMVSEYLKGVKVSATGKDALIKIALTEQQITNLISLAEMFMGGMGGMGGGGGMGGPPPGAEPPPGGAPPAPGQ